MSAVVTVWLRTERGMEFVRVVGPLPSRDAASVEAGKLLQRRGTVGVDGAELIGASVEPLVGPGTW